MVESGEKRILFVIGGAANIPALLAKMNTPLTEKYDIVNNAEEYNKLEDKYSYDVLVVLYGGEFMKNTLND